ncbi:MFS transporter [Paenibacillus glufosinatiresistens]|uniref:MFS transporter n=1 Tax=Paenibacillus glufosinatiresistens TaxID=3070657 RepID=UPI00286E8664|nr:MFS transporter [Paenibacillus sp. YX.27]
MRTRSYYGLLATVSLSTFGDAFGLLAMEWLVYDLTGSKLAMGALALSSGIPELLVRLVGSPLSDRLHRVRLMAGLSAIRLLAVLLPLAMGLAGELRLWHLFAAAALSGVCSALFLPSAMASIPGLAPSGGLVRAFALADGLKGMAALLGPAAAGLVTAAGGALPALGANAVCCAAAIAALLAITGTERPAASGAVFSIKLYLHEIGEGFAFYLRTPAMLTIMLMAAVSNLSSGAIWTMMVPYVREVLHQDAGAVGTLSTASAFGYLAGLGLVSWMGDVSHRRLTMLGSLAGIGVINMLWSQLPFYPAALFAAGAAGFLSPFFSSLSSSLHGRLVPASLQGRVNSIRFLIGGALQPVGAVAGGAFAELWGVPALFLAAGLLPVLFCAAALLLPGLKTLDGRLPAAS